MGYQSIKDGISKMLKAKGFVESDEVFDFEEGSDESTDRKFRVERPTFTTDGEGSLFLQTIVRPLFSYRVVLGFKVSPQRQTVDYDVSQIAVDQIIAYFNNPTNYQSFCIKMRTVGGETRLVDEHIEAEINLEVLDDVALA